MKILITGGAGFIGSHLCDVFLSKGHEVIAIDDLSLGRENNLLNAKKDHKFRFIKMNILEKNVLDKLFKDNRFDMVIHLAANSDILAGTSDLRRDLNLNFLTTINILECMKDNNVKQIWFASTSAIYGEHEQKLSENSGPLFPISFYGASKLSAEGYITAYSHNFNIQAWIFRFPNVVGSRATHGVIYNLFHQLKKNDSVLELLGNGMQEKPYLHVSELIEAMNICFEKSKESLNCFNIGCNSSTTVTKIGELVIDRYGKHIPIKYAGGTRGWKGDVKKYLFDLSKIETLGWKAKLTSEDAIKKAVDEIYEEIIGL
ncbi:NAD-dependent epimerase/dehydratase family protein [Candidatus Woesearchaeota archaeon]|nr:NAD-dependent epimerase/dehydratase family protein [Candidatus Woesearchaeota archaeon]